MDKKVSWPDPKKKAFGAKVIITLKMVKIMRNGVVAHPYGSRPLKENYIIALTLTEDILDKKKE